ncbi:MAG: hypothetical protein FIA92_04565 [Chloroflexi bacterium]|nr:hypothetical protein [Chloroflexota bacterium]
MTDQRTDAPVADELEPEPDELEPAPRPRQAPKAAPPARRGGFAIDPALRIRDRWAAAFVIGSTAVFVGIFLYAAGFGKGGAFTPPRTPAPIVSPSPGVSPSGLPSGSPAVSPTTPASTGTSPVASPAPTPEASPAAT